MKEHSGNRQEHPGDRCPSKVTRLQATHVVVFDVVPVLLIVSVPFLFPDLRPRGYDWFVFFTMWLVSLLGITVGFHRLFTHRSFKCGGALKIVLGWAGSMAAAGPLIAWVATHRKHHQSTDVEGDPHSPHLGGGGILGKIKGLWHAQFGWTIGHPMTSPLKYARELLEDPVTLRISRNYFGIVALGIIIPAVGSQLVEPGWGSFLSCIVWGGFARIAFVHHVISSVNSICHRYGSRPFDTKEESRNNRWLALPTFGEGWHNNHHRFPSSAYIGLRRREFDLGGTLISALQRAGLIWNVMDARQRLDQDEGNEGMGNN